MTSPDYYLFAGSNCLEPSLGQFFLEYIPICNQVPRPVISTIVDPYMLFYEKWEIITEIFDSWKIQNGSIFCFCKAAPKIDKFFNFLPDILRVAILVSQS